MKITIIVFAGDCLLQTGANSAVGLFVIQLAKEWGIKTVNVIRARPDPKDTDKLKAELIDYGADFVVTDQDLRQKEVMNQIWSKGAPKPKLALDCVGGKMANDCISYLDFKGTMVIYGSMSRQPLVLPTGPFIFKDLRFYSFWLTRWRNDKSKTHDLHNMIKELSSLMKSRKLRLPKVIPFDLADYKNAFDALNSEFSRGKVIFTMKE